jgi:hypothetical protein
MIRHEGNVGDTINTETATAMPITRIIKDGGVSGERRNWQISSFFSCKTKSNHERAGRVVQHYRMTIAITTTVTSSGDETRRSVTIIRRQKAVTATFCSPIPGEGIITMRGEIRSLEIGVTIGLVITTIEIEIEIGIVV